MYLDLIVMSWMPTWSREEHDESKHGLIDDYIAQ